MKSIYDNKCLKNNKKEISTQDNDQFANKHNSTPLFNGNMFNILTPDRIFPVPTFYLPVIKLSNVNNLIKKNY